MTTEHVSQARCQGFAKRWKAALLLASPALLAGASDVELGCGPLALPSLAALRWCRLAVATDGSAAALGLLRQNAARVGPLFVIERLRLQRLELDGSAVGAGGSGGDDNGLPRRQRQQRLLRSACPAGYDVVVSAARAPPALPQPGPMATSSSTTTATKQ